MNVPQSFTILELDEDLEVAGKRVVSSKQTVIPIYSPPPELAGLRYQLDSPLLFVEELEFGWFDADENIDYSLANRSLWYFAISATHPTPSEREYDRAWNAFRKVHVEGLASMLGKSSWGFGNGIASRRGQELFVVELDGMEHPLWRIHVSVEPQDTYGSCWNTAWQIEDFFARIIVA